MSAPPTNSNIEVERIQGVIERVPRGTIPKVELQLKDEDRIISVELRESAYDNIDRKTVDWKWSAYVCRRRA